MSNNKDRVGASRGTRGSTSEKDAIKQMKAKTALEARAKFFICLKCEAGVEEEENSIQCHDCKQWSHIKCTPLTERDFSYLSDKDTTRGIEWICERCLSGEGEKKTEVEAKMDRLINLFERVNERLERLEKGCGGKALEEKIEEVVEKKVEELWEEKVEKEKREMNLVFTNIPESSGEDGDKRKEDDLKKVKEIIKKTCPDMEDQIEEPTRLGQYNIGSRPRLLRVKVKKMEAKKEILRNARRVNVGKTDQKDKIYINPDYTSTERKRNKELREELREKIKNGERDIGIRGGKIVRVQWKSRPDQGEQERM